MRVFRLLNREARPSLKGFLDRVGVAEAGKNFTAEYCLGNWTEKQGTACLICAVLPALCCAVIIQVPGGNCRSAILTSVWCKEAMQG